VRSLLGLIGAVVVAGLGGKRGDGWRAGVIVAPLLFPPMIYAFGWNRLLPLPGEWACVAVWATWAWPVAALLLGSAWRATGRDRWEAALLVTSRWRAIVDVVFPMLWRPALVCFCVLFAFFLGDYAVPHACGLIVGATELLLAAESAAHPGAVLGAALPAAGAILAALVLAAFTWRRAEALDESADRGASESPVGVSVGVTLLTLVAVAGPWWGLLRGIDLVSALAETLQTYESRDCPVRRHRAVGRRVGGVGRRAAGHASVAAQAGVDAGDPVGGAAGWTDWGGIDHRLPTGPVGL
jgi:ABC-type Fe3+ transport system permease subunit